MPELVSRPTSRPTVHPIGRPTGRHTAPVTRAEWTAPDRARLGLALLLLMAVAGCLVLALRQLSEATPAHLGQLVLGLAAALVLVVAVVVVSPRVVRVRDAVVTVGRGRRSHRFDLADETVGAALTATPADPGWTLVLRDGDGTEVTVHRREVDAVVLDHLVRHHRSAVEALRPAPAVRLPLVEGRTLDGHRRSA